MHHPYVIVGDFNVTSEQLVATQWIDQIRGQIVLPPTCNRVHVLTWRTHDRFCHYFSCSGQKRGNDS